MVRTDSDALADKNASLSDDATQEQLGAAIAGDALAYVQALAPAVTASFEAQGQAQYAYALAQASAIEEYPNGIYDSNYNAAMATASANLQTALTAAGVTYSSAELAARSPQETAIAAAEVTAAGQIATNITTWQDATAGNDQTLGVSAAEAALTDVLNDDATYEQYDVQSAVDYNTLAQNLAAASPSVYANEGAVLASAALTNVQTTDSAWLTQQTSLANADESESVTDAEAQAALLDAQASADATLTTSTAAAEQSGVAASLAADAAIIAAGDSASTTPLLPTPAAALTVANLAIGAPSLPSQPGTDTFYQNAMDGVAYGFSFVPQTSYNDPGNLNEDLNLAATETAVRAPLIYDQGGTNSPSEVAAVAITPPTGETYQIANLADGGGGSGGTSSGTDGNIWTPSAGDVNGAPVSEGVGLLLAGANSGEGLQYNSVVGAAPSGFTDTYAASQVTFGATEQILYADTENNATTTPLGPAPDPLALSYSTAKGFFSVSGSPTDGETNEAISLAGQIAAKQAKLEANNRFLEFFESRSVPVLTENAQLTQEIAQLTKQFNDKGYNRLEWSGSFGPDIGGYGGTGLAGAQSIARGLVSSNGAQSVFMDEFLFLYSAGGVGKLIGKGVLKGAGRAFGAAPAKIYWRRTRPKPDWEQRLQVIWAGVD